jgi:hypothetical protein
MEIVGVCGRRAYDGDGHHAAHGNSLCLMFGLRFRARTTAHPIGTLFSIAIWFKDFRHLLTLRVNDLSTDHRIFRPWDFRRLFLSVG